MKRSTLHLRGFTLLETLLYSGLVMLVIGVLVMSSLSLFESYDKDRGRQAVLENITFVDQKLDWLFDGVVATTVSPLSGSAAVVTATRPDGAQVGVGLQNGAIVMLTDTNGDGQVNSTDTGTALTNSRVTVSDFTVTRAAPNGQAVLSIAATVAGQTSTQSFTKQVRLR